MYDEELESRITPEDILELNTILDDDEINNFLAEYIESILDKVLFNILEDECYSLEYDSSELDDAVTWNKELEVNKIVNHIDEFDLEQLKQMVTNCSALQIKPEVNFKNFKQALEQEFVMNTCVGHHNPHTNEDVTVNVKIVLEIDSAIVQEIIVNN